MPERTVTDYRLEIDRGQTGEWSDVTDLVEEFEVTYGTDAGSSIADVRMRTASGRVRVLNRPETAVEDVTPIRVRAGERTAWEGRCVPSVHEPLVDPDFFYWSLEGKYAHDLRKTHDYFIAPRSNAGTLGTRDFNAFVDWSVSTMRTSWITGEMTPAQLVNRLANVCGGYAVETLDGFVQFVNVVDAMNEGATLFLPSDLNPEVGSSVHVNRQSVRTDTKIRGTNYIADPANPVPVGATELRYLFGQHAPLLTFKPAANRNLRIDKWVTARGPDDVSFGIFGQGGRHGRIRAPITGVAGTAELFYVPNIPAAGTRTGDDAVFVIDFLADVSRLQSFDIRTARFSDAVETFGSVDANLAPWATQHGYQHVLAPWLELRSQPLTAVTAVYTEAQDGEASLEAIRRAQPGIVAAIELPRTDGADALYPVLVLAVTIRFGRDQLPVRTITGVSSESRPVVRAFDFSAEAFGPFDGRGVLEIADPDESKQAYSRYRKSGDTAWTAAAAVAQSDESIFAYDSLTASTLYEAEAGLEADYSDALRDSFVTDPSPEDLLACTFDLVDGDGNTPSGEVRGLVLLQTLGAFLVLIGSTIYQYNAGGRFIRAIPLPAATAANGPIARFPNSSTINGKSIPSSLRGAALGSIQNRFAWLNFDDSPGATIAGRFNDQDGNDPILSILYAYGSDYVQCQLKVSLTSGTAEWLPFRGELWRSNLPNSAAPTNPGSTFGDSWVVSDPGGNPWLAVSGHDGGSELQWFEAGDNTVTTFDLSEASDIRGSALSNDVNRFYAVDQPTKKVWAYDRNGDLCITQAITPLLSSIILNNRPANPPQWNPTVFNYVGFNPSRAIALSRFPNFESYEGPYRVDGIPAIASYTVEVALPSGGTPAYGGRFVEQPAFEGFHEWGVTVTDPISGASSTYRIGVVQDVDRSDPPPPPPPVELGLKVTPTTIQLGESAFLRLETEGSDSRTVTVSGGGQTDIFGGALSGTRTVTPTAVGTVTYTATITDGDETETETATLTVQAAPVVVDEAVIDSFTASPSTILVGQSTTLRWETTNAVSATLDGTSVAVDNTTGIVRTPGPGIIRYTLRATSSDGRFVEETVQVIVVPPVVIPKGVTPEPVGEEAGVTGTGDDETGTAKATVTLNGETLTEGDTVSTAGGIGTKVKVSGRNFNRWIAWLTQPNGLVKLLRISRFGVVSVPDGLYGVITIQFYRGLTLVLTRTFTITTPVIVQKPASGGLTISPTRQLETEAVTVRYWTRNAKSATITTAAGILQIPQRGLPIASGTFTDVPRTTGAIRYTLKMIGADGKAVTVRSGAITVQALPTVGTIDVGATTYSGESVIRVTGSTADSIRITSPAAIPRTQTVRTSTALVGTGSEATVRARVPLTLARAELSFQPLLDEFRVPELAKVKVGATVEWPGGSIVNPNIPHAKNTEFFIKAFDRTAPGAADDIYIRTNPNNLSLVRGDDYAYRAAGNRLRAGILATDDVSRIVPLANFDRAIDGSFRAGAAFRSIITSNAKAFSGILGACVYSCSSRYLSIVHPTLSKLISPLTATRVWIGIMNTNTTFRLGGVPKYFVLISKIGTIATNILSALNIFGLGSTVFAIINSLGEYQIDGFSLAVSLIMLNNAVKETGVNTFKDVFGKTITWTEPRLELPFTPGDEARQHTGILRNFAGDDWSFFMQPVAQEIINDRGQNLSVLVPTMQFTNANGSYIDDAIGKMVQQFDDLYSGAVWGAVLEADVLAEWGL